MIKQSDPRVAYYLPFSCGGRNGLLEDLLVSVAAVAAPVRDCFPGAGCGRCRPGGWPRFSCAGLVPAGAARRLQNIIIITDKPCNPDVRPVPRCLLVGAWNGHLIGCETECSTQLLSNSLVCR